MVAAPDDATKSSKITCCSKTSNRKFDPAQSGVFHLEKNCSKNYESRTRNQLRLKVKRNAESSVKGTFVLSAKSTSISKEHWIRQSRSTLQKQR